ncbi:MAG: efflux RND transporter periplasmic adaptor subunit [Planctomycetota bacterium]|jgi:RND family efflux transporter MFP subunit
MSASNFLAFRRLATQLTWLIGVAIAGAAFAAPQERGESGPPATPVRVQTVERESLQERRLVTGDLRALRRSNVAAREPGLVLRREVEEGQRVQEGDVLAELDARRLELSLRQIEADAEVARAILDERTAELEQSQRDLELLQASYERGAANPRELRDAEAALRVATARRDQSTRLLGVTNTRAELLELRIDDMKIRAPFDGIVVSIDVEQGEWVGEGETVLELVSTGPLEVWLQVPQRFIVAVQDEAAAVSVNIEATRSVVEVSQGRIIPQVDPTARTFTLVGRLENRQGQLSPGMSVTAWVPTSQMAPLLTVPKNALLRNDAGGYVYVVRSGGGPGGTVAAPVSVQALFPVGDRYAVRAGALQEGDTVVVEGNERLFPMMPVTPIVHDEPSATSTAHDEDPG